MPQRGFEPLPQGPQPCVLTIDTTVAKRELKVNFTS